MLTDKTITELNMLHDKAEKTYGSVGDNFRGFAALRSEYLEVEDAFQSRDWGKLRDELMDVANVATRWAQSIDAGEIIVYSREGVWHTHDGDGVIVCDDILIDVVGDMISRLDKIESEYTSIRRELDYQESYRREQSELES